MKTRHALLIAVICSLAVVAQAFAAPRLVVDRPSFDFGHIPQGNKLVHMFTLKNSGDSPLNIGQISTSCGCTAVIASSRVIPAGGAVEIKATFDSANFSGPVSKMIYVNTNDPKTPVYTLSMKGSVDEQVTVTPKQLNLGVIKIGTTREVAISIENRGQKPMNITDVKSSMTQVTAKVKKHRLEPGGATVIKVFITPRPEDRLLSCYLAISTDNPSKREITVPIYATLAK